MAGCQVLWTSSGIQSLAHCSFFKTDVREHAAKIWAAAKESEAATCRSLNLQYTRLRLGLAAPQNALLYLVITSRLNGDFEQLHFFPPLFSDLAWAMHSDSHEGTYSRDYQSKSESFLAGRLCDSASLQEMRVGLCLLPLCSLPSCSSVPSCAKATTVTAADVVLLLHLSLYSPLFTSLMETVEINACPALAQTRLT